MSSVVTSAPNIAQQRDAMVERIFQSTSGAMELFTMYLGDQLGFYEVLAREGPLTV